MLVVTGGMTANPRDRALNRDQIRPVQRLHGGSFVPVRAYDSIGELGVSNIVDWDTNLVVATQTSVLFSGDQHDIHDLDDIHEVTVIGDDLWIANTGGNEAIQLRRDGQIDRTSLGVGKHHHLNQVFKALDGTICALTHHIDGRQFRNRVAGRLLKRQGDGGIARVDSSRSWPLSLTAPHNVRIVGGEHWVLDSGRAQICRFDDSWNPIGSIGVGGWGRGACISADGTQLFVGLSPLRRRYRNHIQGPAVEQTEVHVIDTRTHSVVDRIQVSDIDQINGVQLIDEHLFDDTTPDVHSDVDVDPSPGESPQPARGFDANNDRRQ